MVNNSEYDGLSSIMEVLRKTTIVSARTFGKSATITRDMTDYVNEMRSKLHPDSTVRTFKVDSPGCGSYQKFGRSYRSFREGNPCREIHAKPTGSKANPFIIDDLGAFKAWGSWGMARNNYAIERDESAFKARIRSEAQLKGFHKRLVASVNERDERIAEMSGKISELGVANSKYERQQSEFIQAIKDQRSVNYDLQEKVKRLEDQLRSRMSKDEW